MSFRGWEKNKLVDLTEKIGSGATPRGGSNVYLKSGIPFIRSQNVYNCEFSKDGLVYISEESAKKLDNVKLCKNDIILNITGDSVARCTILPEKYIGGRVNQHVAIIRANNKVLNSQFLKYYLVSPGMQANMLSLAQMGATRAALTKGMIESFQIPTPDVQEQERIAHILSTLDEKIEVNNQINKTLENMAQTIFKQWFVDFEFPNLDGEPYKSSGGEMVESELGMIPKGWEVLNLDDIAVITMGQSPKGTSYNEIGEGLVFYQGRTDFTKRFPERRLYTTEPKRMAKQGDILMSVRAPVGDINIANEECCIGRGLCALNSKKNYNSFLLYSLMNLKERFNVFNGEGTVFGSINKNDLNGMKVISGDELIISKFEEIISNMDKQYQTLEQETRNIIRIRDTLLPKLMSGEIRVPMDI